MKKILYTVLALFISVGLFAQFTDRPGKIQLGYQTTANGLVCLVDSIPNFTPSDENDCYLAQDTVANKLYLFRPSIATWAELAGGGGSGATELNELSDVTITSPATGEVLRYNGAAWVNDSIKSLHNIDSFSFNQSATPVTETSSLGWNSEDQTLDLVMNGVTLQIGQEMYVPVLNNTGVTITNGQAVRYDGAIGASSRIYGALMIADGTYPAYHTVGVATENIPNGEVGFVANFGAVRGINTSGYTAGDILYIDATTPGALTNVEPTAPNQAIPVAVALDSKSNGSIFMRPVLFPGLNDVQDVAISSPANGQVLRYDGTKWVNSTERDTSETNEIQYLVFSGDTLGLTDDPTSVILPYLEQSEVTAIVGDTATVLRAYADQSEQDAKDYADANDTDTQLTPGQVISINDDSLFVRRAELADTSTALRSYIDSQVSIVDSTRLTQDSILVYYQGGIQVGRDTITGTGSGGGIISNIDFSLPISFGGDTSTIYYNEYIQTGGINIETPSSTDVGDQAYVYIYSNGDSINFTGEWINMGNAYESDNSLYHLSIWYQPPYWSYLITKAESFYQVDTIAPTFSNVEIGNISATTATFYAQIDELGTIYASVYPRGTTSSFDSVRFGTGAIFSDSLATVGSKLDSIDISGLSVSTQYDIHYAAIDDSLNQTIVFVDTFSTSLPQLNAPDVSLTSLSSNSIQITLTDTNTSPNEDSTLVQVDTVNTFNSGALQQLYIAQDVTLDTLTSLADSTLYFARAKAVGSVANSTSDSEFSSVDSVLTQSLSDQAIQWTNVVDGTLVGNVLTSNTNNCQAIASDTLLRADGSYVSMKWLDSDNDITVISIDESSTTKQWSSGSWMDHAMFFSSNGAINTILNGSITNVGVSATANTIIRMRLEDDGASGYNVVYEYSDNNGSSYTEFSTETLVTSTSLYIHANIPTANKQIENARRQN